MLPPFASGLTVRFSRVAGIEDSYAGKTRHNNQSVRWGSAVATSAASGCWAAYPVKVQRTRASGHRAHIPPE